MIQEIINLLKRKFPSRVQMFDCRDCMGDLKEVLYCHDGVTVLYAPDYEYVEVLGLSEDNYDAVFKVCGR